MQRWEELYSGSSTIQWTLNDAALAVEQLSMLRRLDERTRMPRHVHAEDSVFSASADGK